MSRFHPTIYHNRTTVPELMTFINSHPGYQKTLLLDCGFHTAGKVRQIKFASASFHINQHGIFWIHLPDPCKPYLKKSYKHVQGAVYDAMTASLIHVL